MLVLLSPAKNLDFAAPPGDIPRTRPSFTEDTAALAAVAKRLSADDLSRLMDISPKLAEQNRARFRDFVDQPDEAHAKQAILAFNGDVYQGLDAKTLSVEDLVWAQDHVRILSGLYGLLRPLDAIQPYRLEMGTRLPTPRGKTLYEFWGRKLADAIDAERPGLVLNLASQEYVSAVDQTALNTPMITLAFKDVKDGRARPVFMFVKRARGAFARHIIQRRITDPEALKRVVLDGYRFDAQGSTDGAWTFTRPQPAPKPNPARARKAAP